MSILDGSTQVMRIGEEQQNFYEMVREAEDHGYKFIELHLNPTQDRNRLNPGNQYRFKFIRGLLMTKRMIGNTGMAETDLAEGSVELIFRNDPLKRAHVAFMLDDTGKGAFSKIGYNRDFLASNYASGMFKIMDKEIEADVKRRLEILMQLEKTRLDKKAIDNAPLTEAQTKTMSTEEIDAQIKFLEDCKKRVQIGKQVDGIPAEQPVRMMAEKAKAPEVVPETDEGDDNPLGELDAKLEPQAQGIATMKT